MSVNDIVQLSRKGRDDRTIVALIQETDSTFQLEAEDLPRLKSSGVSEAVIRAMLQHRSTQAATAARAPATPPESDETDPADGVGAAIDAAGQAHAHGTTAPPRAIDERSHDGQAEGSGGPSDLISAVTVREERAGSHEHVAVAFGGVEVVLFRDEGGYASVEARAADAVGRLREAQGSGSGEFRVRPSRGGPEIVFQGADGDSLLLLQVTANDARSFEQRSSGRVTPERLAQYWADLLGDFWAVSIDLEAPSRLLDLHEGDALALLHSDMSRPESAPDFAAAVRRLPPSTLHHLRMLATAVPAEYGEASR